MRKSWVFIALVNFFIAAVMGLILRAAWVWELEWLDYRNMMHAHSHVAMLGWVFLILYAFFVDYFVSPGKRGSKSYVWLFWFTQITVIGMMISFPLQGYATVSITSSAVHILASYLFAYRIWKDVRPLSPAVMKLLKGSLIFMVLSTLGIWAMGPIIAADLKNDPLYFIAVQFYLHFQFNGWFVLAVLAIFLQLFTQWGFTCRSRSFNVFFWLYVLSIVLSFFQVMYWAYSESAYYYINSLGVVIQLIAFTVLAVSVGKMLFEIVKKKDRWVQILFGFAVIALIAKICIQAALVSPEIADVSTTIRNFLLGYIHLITLGIVTGFVMMFLYVNPDFRPKPIGLILIVIGFLGTEILLFSQGYALWTGIGPLPFYNQLLAVFSLVLVLAIPFLLKMKSQSLKNEKWEN